MQFYTGGFLGDKFADAKDGATYPRFGGLCLEAQVRLHSPLWEGGGVGVCPLDKFAYARDGATYPRFGGLCQEAHVRLHSPLWRGGGRWGGGVSALGTSWVMQRMEPFDYKLLMPYNTLREPQGWPGGRDRMLGDQGWAAAAGRGEWGGALHVCCSAEARLSSSCKDEHMLGLTHGTAAAAVGRCRVSLTPSISPTSPLWC
jgi:hypothetical protein